MMTRWGIWGLCWLAVSASVPAQGSLNSTQRRQVKRVLELLDAGSDDEARGPIREVAAWGGAADRHLTALASKDPGRAGPLRLLRRLEHVRGRDLETKEVDDTPDPWTPWAVSAGEVVLAKGVGRWVGLRVQEDNDPSSDVLNVELAWTEDPLLPLGGAGVTRERRSLKGTVVVLEGSQPAFPVRDYAVTVDGVTIRLRSAGSQAFRFSLGADSSPVARTGQRSLRRVKGSMKGLSWRGRPDEAAAAATRRLQQYLFRLVDGVDPLPTYGTEDESRFAHAESVRVMIRESHEGKRFVVIALPFSDEDVAYDPLCHKLVLAFVERNFSISDEQVLVYIGQQEARSANLFYAKGRWRRLRGGAAKRVQELFPEDY